MARTPVPAGAGGGARIREVLDPPLNRGTAMHIAEGFLPVSHCIAWGAVAAPFIIHGAYRVNRIVKENPGSGMILGAAGAFSFVLSAMKIPSVTGSTSHPTGTGLGAVLFKPPVMAFISAVVLLFQALLLAHGGITTLGANIFSMGIVGPWIGYLGYVAARRLGAGVLPGVFVAAFLADLSTYVVTSIQLAVAHPAEPGGVGGALAAFLGIFAVTQIPLAVIEALLTVLVVRALMAVAPTELLDLGVLTREEIAPEVDVDAAGRTAAPTAHVGHGEVTR